MKLQKNPYIKRERKPKDHLMNSIVDSVVHRLHKDGYLYQDEDDDEAEDEGEQDEVETKPANRLRNRR